MEVRCTRVPTPLMVIAAGKFGPSIAINVIPKENQGAYTKQIFNIEDGTVLLTPPP